ncbi:MAG: HAD family hydrolase [Muribaculum sp.]|nr:HAD family hydrolase [Muribaculum sp.]
MTKTLYISDLDGTLLNTQAILEPSTIRKLNSLIRRGVTFSVATARTPATVGPLLKDVNLQLPTVVMTGVTLWQREQNLYTQTEFMQEDVPARLLEIYRQYNVPTFVYTLNGSMIDIYHQGDLNPIEKAFMNERLNSPYKKFHIDKPMPDKLDNVLLFYGMVPQGAGSKVYEKTKEMAPINALCYTDIYGNKVDMLEAFPAAATKANAIRKLASIAGAERIVAFGDSVNDLSMREVADVFVAVDNASEEVKATADIVIGPNTAESVPDFIASELGKRN